MVDSPEKSLMHKREHPSPHPIPYSCRAKLLVLLLQNVTMPVAVTQTEDLQVWQMKTWVQLDSHLRVMEVMKNGTWIGQLFQTDTINTPTCTIWFLSAPPGVTDRSPSQQKNTAFNPTGGLNKCSHHFVPRSWSLACACVVSVWLHVCCRD